MVEHVKRAMSSGTAKAALGIGIGGLGLGVLNGGMGLLRNPFGGPAAACAGDPTGGYVTVRESFLMRDGSEKDAEIAMLRAERYADAAIKTEVEPLKARVCELETAVAVNSARDHDYRRYVEREFVHQPKAKMRQSIVVCKQCGCDCECDGD